MLCCNNNYAALKINKINCIKSKLKAQMIVETYMYLLIVQASSFVSVFVTLKNLLLGFSTN